MRTAFYRVVKKLFNDENHWEELSFFRNVPIFYGLSSHQLGRIMQVIQKRKYYAGEILFQEGQIGKAVFIIKSGQVELIKNLASGEVMILGKLGPGQIFGEMALLEHRPRTAGARVIEDGEIFLLYTATLESLLKNHPNIGVKLMKNIAVMLSALLRRTNQELENLKKA